MLPVTPYRPSEMAEEGALMIAKTPPPNNALILLVEDNEDDVQLTMRALEKNSVAAEDVAVVRDGAQALDYIFATGQHADRDAAMLPALILLDINLPKVSGLEVLRRLRSDERTKFIPVVMLTSSRQERDVLESYGYGANSYVQKPVDSHEFDEAVQQLAAYWLGLNELPDIDKKLRIRFPPR